MYAIQSGSKFLNAKFYFNPDDIVDVTVSATPKTYKTRAEVDRMADLIAKYIFRAIDSTTKRIDSEQAEVSKATKDVARLEAKLAELVEQPYKDVVKKVAQTQSQLENARWKIKASSVSSYRKDLARLEKINAQGFSVVKMQQVSVAV